MRWLFDSEAGREKKTLLAAVCYPDTRLPVKHAVLSSPRRRSHFVGVVIDAVTVRHRLRSGGLLDAVTVQHRLRSGGLLDAVTVRHRLRSGGLLDAVTVRHRLRSGGLLDAVAVQGERSNSLFAIYGKIVIIFSRHNFSVHCFVR